MTLLYWVGGFVVVLATALLGIRWLFGKNDPRNYELPPEEHPQPWSDPTRFGEDP